LEHLLLVSIKPGTLAFYIAFLKEYVLDKEVWDPCVNCHGFEYFAFVGATNFVSPVQLNGNGG
jgi:hypothetical protein